MLGKKGIIAIGAIILIIIIIMFAFFILSSSPGFTQLFGGGA